MCFIKTNSKYKISKLNFNIERLVQAQNTSKKSKPWLGAKRFTKFTHPTHTQTFRTVPRH